MSTVKKAKSKNIIRAATVRRGIWRSNQAYAEVSSALRFPPFDIVVMNVYDALVAAGGVTFWQMKATSNGSFFLFPKNDKKEVEVISPNGKRARLSVEASGVVATLFAFKRLAACLAAAAAFRRLLEYARQRPEFPVIDSLIDGL
jgi:hypothetical protein